MFEALIDVLKALVAELKRYNDGRGALDTAATPTKTVVAEKPAAKTAPAKAAATTKAPSAQGPDFATVQKEAIKFSALFGKESIGAILVDLGVPVATGEAKPKLSNAKEDSVLLAKISKAMADVAAAAEASTDPTA